ncbi:MAG: MBOAT family protein [Acetobacteraceae bacterium]|nr:MBOAT family protein [Acetobacteraceae bacterium]
MLFTSPVFALGFLPVALGGFWALGRVGAGQLALAWLLAASLFFYAWWNPVFVLLLVGSIAGNWLVGRGIAASRGTVARVLVVGGVAADLGALCWFKYAGFLFGVNRGAVLPLGISFFTFQQISFLIDDYRASSHRDRGSAVPAKMAGSSPAMTAGVGPLEYAAFAAFFAHLIAGPIVRAREIVPQLVGRNLAVLRSEEVVAGLTIFLLGLAKKLVLADTFAQFADVGFGAAAHGAGLSFLEAWYAVLAYALQIYFDFSGYSDMAIGLARMFNIRFPLNFDSPYQSLSIAEFWRRWHITLGAFLKEYVYIPLGGNRVGERRRLMNLMATMLLGGLWHGAAWSFVIWGGLHGSYLVIHSLWRRSGIVLPREAGWALTMLAVIVAWVPFRAAGMHAAWAMWWGMAGLNGIMLPRMVLEWLPALRVVATPTGSLPYLGDGRTLSFPEVTACLGLGWFIVLALPNLHQWNETWRTRGVAVSFAFAVQAMFFAPSVTPFLYFQF